VSVRAAAEPRPEAGSVPWVQQVAGEAAAVPDESGPREVVASDVTVRQVAARREDAAVQLRAAVQSDVAVLQEAAWPVEQRAAVPLALPSAAASVFRQDPSLGSGPARPRVAARFAHAMWSLRLASRSEPSWRAARNEDWSWW
jgi:hypothetical protein